MVKVTDQDYYIDGIHKENLDIAKKEIKNDWDMLFCYDGPEGSGKSVKAMQDAYYCDPTLSLDRICFTPQEFKKAIDVMSRIYGNHFFCMLYATNIGNR